LEEEAQQVTLEEEVQQVTLEEEAQEVTWVEISPLLPHHSVVSSTKASDI
jgi:hypothetical protein